MTIKLSISLEKITLLTTSPDTLFLKQLTNYNTTDKVEAHVNSSHTPFPNLSQQTKTAADSDISLNGHQNYLKWSMEETSSEPTTFDS